MQPCDFQIFIIIFIILFIYLFFLFFLIYRLPANNNKRGVFQAMLEQDNGQLCDVRMFLISNQMMLLLLRLLLLLLKWCCWKQVHVSTDVANYWPRWHFIRCKHILYWGNDVFKFPEKSFYFLFLSSLNESKDRGSASLKSGYFFWWVFILFFVFRKCHLSACQRVNEA